MQNKQKYYTTKTNCDQFLSKYNSNERRHFLKASLLFFSTLKLYSLNNQLHRASCQETARKIHVQLSVCEQYGQLGVREQLARSTSGFLLANKFGQLERASCQRTACQIHVWLSACEQFGHLLRALAPAVHAAADGALSVKEAAQRGSRFRAPGQLRTL